MQANLEFGELLEQGMLLKFYGSDGEVEGGLDGTCAQLVGW